MTEHLIEAFDLIHNGLRMIRLHCEHSDDPDLCAAMGRADVALLKEVGYLRKKLGIPYTPTLVAFDTEDEDV